MRWETRQALVDYCNARCRYYTDCKGCPYNKKRMCLAHGFTETSETILNTVKTFLEQQIRESKAGVKTMREFAKLSLVTYFENRCLEIVKCADCVYDSVDCPDAIGDLPDTDFLEHVYTLLIDQIKEN